MDDHLTVYDIARWFPSIADPRNLCRSQAMLDAILSPDREDRARLVGRPTSPGR